MKAGCLSQRPGDSGSVVRERDIPQPRAKSDCRSRYGRSTCLDVLVLDERTGHASGVQQAIRPELNVRRAAAPFHTARSAIVASQRPETVVRRIRHPGATGQWFWRCGCLFIGLLTALVHAAGATIQLSAAASLADAVRDIAATYAKQSTNKVVVNLGASNFLARQIQEGAPVDIFFSADEAKMDDLEKSGLVEHASRRSLLSNTLVIVVPKDAKFPLTSPSDLATARVKRLAIAEPRTVPAGIYAREYLQNQRLWSAVQEKVVPTDSVRAALAAVEAGNVEAGMVYKTDAGISKRVKIAFEIPASAGLNISYSVAVMKGAPEKAAAYEFLTYLGSDEAKTIFEKFGFIVRH